MDSEENTEKRFIRRNILDKIEIIASLVSVIAALVAFLGLDSVGSILVPDSLTETAQGLSNIFVTILVIVISIAIGISAIVYITKWNSNRNEQSVLQLTLLREAEENLFEEIKVRTHNIIEERTAIPGTNQFVPQKRSRR